MQLIVRLLFNVGSVRKSQKEFGASWVIIEKGPFEALHQDLDSPSVWEGHTARPIFCAGGGYRFACFSDPNLIISRIEISDFDAFMV